MLDSPSEILLEMIESKNVAVNEAPVESLLDQNFQFTHAEHRNGALPADPDVILPLRLQVYKGVAEEPACHCPIEFSPQRDHGEGFAHARSNKLFDVRVQDDVVEWLRIAVEHRRHNAV